MNALAADTHIADRYVLVEPAHDRGLGVSWRARDLQRPDALVLIKLLDMSAAHGADPRTALRALRALRHPCLPAVVGHGTHQGVDWLALDDCAGLSFGTLLDRARHAEPLPLPWVRGVFDGVASAVMAAHESSPSLMHLALSPGSVIVPEGALAGRACVVLDLGVAGWLGSAHDAPSRSARGHLTRPPELLQGAQVDARADVFMLGALLSEMLARPASPGETMAAVSLDRRRPDVPDPVWATIAHAMKSSRDARPASVREFVGLLHIAWLQATNPVNKVGGGVGSLLESIAIEGGGPSLNAPILPRFKLASEPVSPVLGPMPDLTPLPVEAPVAELNPWSSLALDRVIPVPTLPPLVGTAGVLASGDAHDKGPTRAMTLGEASAFSEVVQAPRYSMPTANDPTRANPYPSTAWVPSTTMRVGRSDDDDNAATLAFEPASPPGRGSASASLDGTLISEGPVPWSAPYASLAPRGPSASAPGSTANIPTTRATVTSAAALSNAPRRSAIGWVLIALVVLVALIAALWRFAL
jgi:hypothetical protein